jgi:acetyl-CoA C-acetyltransferase
MIRNVAVVGYKQTVHTAASEVSRERMVYELVKSFYQEMGITKDDIDTFVMCTNDFQEGRTISEVYMVPRIGAYMKDETKVDSDGINAVFYGLMRILSGNYETALIVGYGMGGSEFPGPMIFNHMLDPIYERQLGLVNEISAAALQANAYMRKYRLTELHLAKIAAKNVRNASRNPYAVRRIDGISADDVLSSRLLYSPLRELHMYPPTDGACVLMLASEEKARQLTDTPVWILGAANCQETYYLGERDLTLPVSLKLAAKQAYKMAKIRKPSEQIDLAELHTNFASQEPIFAEALGLYPRGSGGSVIEKGESEVTGKIPLNPSGGPLGANPFTACGIIRIAEACAQLRGEAGANQVKDARIAVAHGYVGICAQHNTVFVLGTSPAS